MTPTEPLQPAVYPPLVAYFQSEVDNFRDNVRNGNLDAADGFHPTLSSALDSLDQAPEDYRLDWLGIEADDDDLLAAASAALSVMTNFAWLIVVLGPEYPLVNILGVY